MKDIIYFFGFFLLLFLIMALANSCQETNKMNILKLKTECIEKHSPEDCNKIFLKE